MTGPISQLSQRHWSKSLGERVGRLKEMLELRKAFTMAYVRVFQIDGASKQKAQSEQFSQLFCMQVPRFLTIERANQSSTD